MHNLIDIRSELKKESKKAKPPGLSVSCACR